MNYSNSQRAGVIFYLTALLFGGYDSLEKVAALPVKEVFPGHHSLDIQPEILIRMRDAFRSLRADGKLHHGSGTFQYGDWGVWL